LTLEATEVNRIIEPLVIFAISVILAIPFLGQPPFTDELTHILAARSLLDTGEMTILPGSDPYTRGVAITYLVAGMFWIFGESLFVARIPALTFGGLLAVSVFLWVRVQVGRTGAWFAALLLIAAPISLQLSLWVRTYTLYALLYFLACVLIYHLVARPTRPWVGIGLASTALLVFASMERLTGTGTVYIGAAGLGFWVVLTLLPRLLRRLSTPAEVVGTTLLLAALASLALVLALRTGFVDGLLEGASYVDIWGEADRYNFRFYHDRFMAQQPVLWVLLPAAIVIALTSRWTATTFCLSIFGVAFVSHSLVASKADRYLYYALPMFYAIWGIALGTLRIRLAGWITNASRSVRMATIAGGTLILTSLVLYPTIVRPAALFAIREVRSGDARWAGWGRPAGHPDWVAAASAMEPFVTTADAVIATDEAGAYYGLSRIDYLMRRTYTPWQGILNDFDRYRGIVPVISTAEALDLVIACNRSGIVFVETRFLTRDWTGVPDMIPELVSRLDRHELPRSFGLDAYTWNHVAGSSGPAECDSLPVAGPEVGARAAQ
jgi:hypothetical protein